MRSFVTGGAGFIGSHIVDKVLDKGDDVTVYDNMSTGSRDRIQHRLGKPRFTLVEADLIDFNALRKAMEGHDVVWHLGGNTDIRKGNTVTDLDLKYCTMATRNVLEAMRKNHIDKILFASSGTVYGDAQVRLSESFGPLLPISLYGAGKLACEGLLSAYSHLYGINAWIFRFANVVGGKMTRGVIYDFIQKLKRNSKQLEILGDGRQRKPFFLVEDCIEGMLLAFKKANGHCEVFNLGCESFTDVDGVARIVVEEMGLKDVQFSFTDGERGWPGDVPVVTYDVDKMNKLGWKVSVTSDEAVRIAARRLLDKRGA